MKKLILSILFFIPLLGIAQTLQLGRLVKRPTLPGTYNLNLNPTGYPVLYPAGSGAPIYLPISPYQVNRLFPLLDSIRALGGTANLADVLTNPGYVGSTTYIPRLRFDIKGRAIGKDSILITPDGIGAPTISSFNNNTTATTSALNLRVVHVADIASMTATAGSATVSVQVRQKLRGGSFYYAATGYTVDNGVVFPAAGGGFWVRQYMGYTTAEMFGVVGDNVADDTQALQSAITAVCNANNPAVYAANSPGRFSNTLFIKHGLYRVTDELFITGSCVIQMEEASSYGGTRITQYTSGKNLFHIRGDNDGGSSGVKITGGILRQVASMAGAETALIYGGESTGDANNNSTRLEKIWFATPEMYGVNILRGDDPKIVNCTFDVAAYRSIKLGSATGTVSNALISGNTFYQTALSLITLVNVNSVVITQNTVYDNDGSTLNAIFVNAQGGTVKGLTISSNNVHEVAQFALIPTSALSTIITGNNVYNGKQFIALTGGGVLYGANITGNSMRSAGAATVPFIDGTGCGFQGGVIQANSFFAGSPTSSTLSAINLTDGRVNTNQINSNSFLNFPAPYNLNAPTSNGLFDLAALSASATSALSAANSATLTAANNATAIATKADKFTVGSGLSLVGNVLSSTVVSSTVTSSTVNTTYTGRILFVILANSLGAEDGARNQITGPTDFTTATYGKTALADLKAAFPNATIDAYNYSVTGKQTPAILNDIAPVLALYNPSLYSFQIVHTHETTNYVADGGATLTQATNSFTALTSALVNKGFLVSTATITPRNSFASNPTAVNAILDQFNTDLRTNYISKYKADLLYDMAVEPGIVQSDGTHYNQASYVAFGHGLAKKIIPIIPLGFNPQVVAFLKSGSVSAGSTTTVTSGTSTTATSGTGVVLSLRGQGANNSTTITDDAGHVMTANGNAKNSTAQLSGAILLDGSAGTYVSTPSNTDFNFGVGDFTMEAIIYKTGLGSGFPGVFARGDNTQNQWALAFPNAGSRLEFYVSGSGGYLAQGLNHSVDVPLNTQVHIALVSSGGVRKLYQNGVLVGAAGTNSNLETNTTGKPLLIGYLPAVSQSGGDVFPGYIKVKITKSALYTTTGFTPPTTF